MAVLNARNLSKYYGPDMVFEDITLDVPQRARIALVGPNGAGKTTLIDILAGRDVQTNGQVIVSKNTRVAYLPQRPELAGEHTLWEEQLHAFTDLLAMRDQLQTLEAQLADPEQHDAVLETYGALQAEFDRIGGYNYETQIQRVLTGIGFRQDEYETPLPQLSGGQRTRALLARLLLEEPDVLILDEPTNHLDVVAIEWLENYLKDFPGAVVAVSHDRYFIDTFAKVIWELEFHQMQTYRGNYTHYIQQRDERRDRLQKDYDAQQEHIQKEMDYIRKHMGSRHTTQAKGRLKRLNTMEKRGKVIRGGPKNRKKMSLTLEAERSGNKVLMTKDVQVGYYDDQKVLLEVPDITLWRGETAALMGPNGVGKTTFLKTATQQIQALQGEVELGANVQIGYFAQAHELLNPKRSILDEILHIKPMPTSEARNYLGRFLFSGDDVFRKIETLSGGERGRVALAKLALSGANLLLLDEPTNHLDIDSQEILQVVLEQFEGTILLVSHDRYLIDALATQIWMAEQGHLTVFEGTYQEYVTMRNRKIEAENAIAKANKQPRQIQQKNSHGLSQHALQKKVTELETQISTLEDELADLTKAIEIASADGDAMEVARLGETYTQIEQSLEKVMEDWATYAE